MFRKLKSVVSFYVEGFKSMTVGRSLWVIILIKLFIMFAVIKVLFFPNKLSSTYDNDDERATAVRNELINK